MRSRREVEPVPQACLLAMIAGYADAVGFEQFGAFAGMMTGNTVLLGIELLNDHPLDALRFAAIIAAFFAGVVMSRALLRLERPPWLALVGAAAALVLCSFVGAGWAAPLLALAMGMQNAAATHFGGVTLNTVFITGNLQRLGEGLVDRFWPGREAGAARRTDLGILALVWLSYAAGAVGGAAGYAFAAKPLLLPAALLPFVLLRRRGG